jgi:hypothetical protein
MPVQRRRNFEIEAPSPKSRPTPCPDYFTNTAPGKLSLAAAENTKRCWVLLGETSVRVWAAFDNEGCGV